MMSGAKAAERRRSGKEESRRMVWEGKTSREITVRMRETVGRGETWLLRTEPTSRERNPRGRQPWRHMKV